MIEIYSPSREVRDWLQIYEPTIPDWLSEYINAPELLRLCDISMICGIDHSKLVCSPRTFHSNLDHSVGVALIVWHFTHDKKQTLAGLFHDISTPAFKHCVDVMNDDVMTQESTEGLTHDIIAKSPTISKLLKRDHIKVAEVDNYHLYPIADNDTPQLAADRLEYSLSNAHFRFGKISLAEAKEFFDDLEVVTNEQGLPELAFKSKKLATKFVKLTSELSVIYRGDESRYSMRFIAEIFKKLNQDGIVTKSDLFRLSENEVIDIIEHSDFAEVFAKWREATEIKNSPTPPEDAYFVNEPSKVRYVDPLVDGVRASTDPLAKQFIADNLAYKMDGYVYLPGINLN